MGGCSSGPSSAQKHLVATSTEVVYEWFTGWRPTTGVKNVRFVLKRRAVTGSFQCRPCYQLAQVRSDNPDAPTLLDTGMTAGAGEKCVASDVALSLGGKMLVRYGVAYALSSGTTPGQADVDLTVVDDGCGDTLGSVVANLTTMTTADGYFVLTGWHPALQSAVVKAAVVQSGLSGNFQARLAYRTATTSVEVPNAWSTAWDGWRGTNGEWCTGELLPSASSDMWVQFAVQYGLSSGTTLGQGVVSVTLTARKA